MSPPRIPLRQRIEENIRKDGACWLWLGSKTRDGYGVMTVGRSKQYRAHRISYEVFKGDIPKGHFVCHACDTPLCVNPDHLFLGSPRDNTQDMIKKGRRALIAGDDHPNSKVSQSERSQIVAMRKSGMLLREIADKYGITFQTVSDICRRNEANGAA